MTVGKNSLRHRRSPGYVCRLSQWSPTGEPVMASNGTGVTCKKCSSKNRGTFSAEVAIHFPGVEGLDKPIVWVFSELLVCLDCGLAEFVVPERELNVLQSMALGF